MPYGDIRPVHAALQKLAAHLSKRVSTVLGNTPAECRQYYIQPKLFSIIVNNEKCKMVIAKVKSFSNEKFTELALLTPIEKRLIDVI
ncbi:hypothetical protein D210916BOD24_13730 [Alteromonas sp. D210916BOD_24]